MIIAKLAGGLGNQLFQYAAAKALALNRGVEVKLDISSYSADGLRKPELENFAADVTLASTEEINSRKAKNSFERLKSRLTPYPRKKFYKEPHFHFDENFFRLPGDVYIQGYFQSEEYFLSYRSEIVQDFRLTADVDLRSLAATVAAVPTAQSVAVHIRRGDYKDPALMQVHGLLPMTYYRQAIQLMKQKLTSPVFFLFSDDVQASLTDLQMPGIIPVSGYTTSNHLHDFYLMSQCRHNIIANSSFSWWAAWLNQHPDKIVIAPKAWFNKGPKDTYDLIPGSWLTI